MEQSPKSNIEKVGAEEGKAILNLMREANKEGEPVGGHVSHFDSNGDYVEGYFYFWVAIPKTGLHKASLLPVSLLDLAVSYGFTEETLPEFSQIVGRGETERIFKAMEGNVDPETLERARGISKVINDLRGALSDYNKPYIPQLEAKEAITVLALYAIASKLGASEDAHDVYCTKCNENGTENPRFFYIVVTIKGHEKSRVFKAPLRVWDEAHVERDFVVKDRIPPMDKIMSPAENDAIGKSRGFDKNRGISAMLEKIKNGSKKSNIIWEKKK